MFEAEEVRTLTVTVHLEVRGLDRQRVYSRLYNALMRVTNPNRVDEGLLRFSIETTPKP
jgi:hypothetical protein